MHYETHEHICDGDKNVYYEPTLDGGVFDCPTCRIPTESVDGSVCELCGKTVCSECITENWKETLWDVCCDCIELGRADIELEESEQV